jgi:hypothetical protein
MYVLFHKLILLKKKPATKVFWSKWEFKKFKKEILFYFYTWKTTLSLIVTNEKVGISRNEIVRFGALKSDSTHHFFRNACTKSGSLRFLQFSGC